MNTFFLIQRKEQPLNPVNPKLFVLFGESNSGGLAPNSSALSSELLPRNLKILNNSTLKFEKTKIGVNNLIGHIGLEYAMNTAHGMELELANKYDEGYFNDKEIYLVKAGAGGSKVQEWGVSDTYFQNFKNRVNTARELLFENYPEDITFMLSIGINNRGVNDGWPIYKSGLQAMIDNLKSELNITNPKLSIMKFQFVTNLDMGLYNAVIDDVATDSNVDTFDTTGLTTIPDGYHLDYLGMKGATNNFLNSL